MSPNMLRSSVTKHDDDDDDDNHDSDDFDHEHDDDDDESVGDWVAERRPAGSVFQGLAEEVTFLATLVGRSP